MCWSYDSDEEYHRLLADYLAAGVQAGDKVVCFVHDAAVAPVLDEFERLVPGRRDDLLDSGRLQFADPRAVYTPDGRFDEERTLDGFRAQATAAAGEGYRALRAAGETAWLFADVTPARLTAYEARCDRLSTTLPLIGLCTYDTRGCDTPDIATMHAVHRMSFGPSPEAPMFRVHARPDGGVGVAGEVDHFGVPVFTRALRDALAACDRPLVDVEALEFVDVAALRAMAAVLAEDRRLHPVEVRGMRPLVRRCWRLLGYDRLVPAVVVV